jgi:hypothetical protein
VYFVLYVFVLYFVLYLFFWRRPPVTVAAAASAMAPRVLVVYTWHLAMLNVQLFHLSCELLSFCISAHIYIPHRPTRTCEH